MIHYTCPQCGESMESPNCLVGQTEGCPSCTADVVVPAPVDEAPSSTLPPVPAETETETDTEPQAPPAGEEPATPVDEQSTNEPDDEPEIDLGVFGEAPSAEDELDEEDGAPPATAEAQKATMPPPSPPQKPAGSMPPPSPVQTQPDWGILDHAKAAEVEVSEEDNADVAAYAIGPQEAEADEEDAEVSEEDIVRQIDISKVAGDAPEDIPAEPAAEAAAALNAQQTAPPDSGHTVFIPGMDEEQAADESPAPQPTAPESDTHRVMIPGLDEDDGFSADTSQQQDTGEAGQSVFIPGMPTDESPAPAAGPTPMQAAPSTGASVEVIQKKTKRTHAPLPLLLLGGLMILLGVLVGAVVVVLALIRSGTLPIESYPYLRGVLDYRPMSMLALNAALLALTGGGYMLLQRYGKVIGWFWVLQIFVVLGVDIALRLQAGSITIADALEPAPLGLIAGSIFLAGMNAAVLLAYGNRFRQTSNTPETTVD